MTAPAAIAPPADAPLPAVADERDDLRAIVQAAMRRLPLAALVGALVAAPLFLFQMAQPKTYAATAELMLNPRSEQLLQTGGDVFSQARPEAAVVESEMEVITSNQLLARAVDELKLTDDPRWNGALRKPGFIDQVLRPRAKTERNPAREREAVIGQLARAVSAERRNLSYVIAVTARAQDPVQAAALANTIVQLHQSVQMEQRFDAIRRANMWLEDRIAGLSKDVIAKESAAQEFRDRAGLVDAGGSPLVEQQAAATSAAVLSARADLAQREGQLRQLEQFRANGGRLDALGPALTSETMARLREAEADIARRQAQIENRYGELHPEVQKIREERANIADRITAELDRISANIANEVGAARQRVATLQRSADQLRGQLVQDNGALVRLRALEREADASRVVYEEFLKRYRTLAEQETLRTGDSRPVAYASVPRRPSSPNFGRALAVALGLGALAGIGAGLLRELSDDALNSGEDVERRLGAPVLGAAPMLDPRTVRRIDGDRATPADYLVHRPRSAFAESMRAMDASLAAALRKRQIVAVCSALPDEGKTTVSSSYARAAALGGRSTLLIDCDLRRAGVADVLKTDLGQGLEDVLETGADWRGVVVADPRAPLAVLGCSGRDVGGKDLFATPAMAKLLSELREHYDLIVLDCPPVLPIAEARSIARHADAVVLVVHAGKTPARAVKSALALLASAGAKVAGVMMNRVDTRSPGRTGEGDTLHYSGRYGAYFSG